MDATEWSFSSSFSSEDEEDIITRSPSMVSSNVNSFNLNNSEQENNKVHKEPSISPVQSAPVHTPSCSRKESKIVNAKSIYLITYSQADAVKVPSRKRFAEIISNEFQRPADGDNKIIKKWACAAEIHPNTNGFHYHMCIHLNRQRRFKLVAQNLRSTYGICVDFQPWVTSYYDAFTYVKKIDSHYCTSENHPELDNGPPRTASAIAAKRKHFGPIGESSGESSKQKSPPKKRKVPNLDIQVLYNIITRTLERSTTTKVKEGLETFSIYSLYKIHQEQKLSIVINCFR